jgi:hypothetical protein
MTTSRHGAVTVRLEKAPTSIHAVCKKAVSRLHYPVICPRSVPRGWSELDCAGCNGTFSITGWFRGPRGYKGVPDEPEWGHMTVWAARRAGIEGLYVGCPDGRAVGTLRLRGGRHAQWIRCPIGSELDSGHVVLQWEVHGVHYGVSAHTDDATNRQLIVDVVSSLEMVAPS